MSFIRSTALRASSVARAARPAVRIAQPLRQSIQRRTYAMGHSHGETKSSDVPWAAAAVASTVGGLYIILTQDLSHGGHDEEHAEHAEKHEEAEEEAPAEEEEEKTESKEESTDQTNVDAPKVEKSDANADDSSKDDSEKTEGNEEGTHSESREKKAEDKKAEHKTAKAQASQEKADDENDEASPDKSDKPDPRKEPKSFNEMSGKQQGMSNDDTHHSSQISKQPEKSKKGEGVAETAKLKGTVSTDRPGAENKEERGKSSMDKDA